jgi:3-oxoacyl-[acyl-carrier protein] reductase
MTQRVTLITGGSSGVGEAVALQLARRGQAVVISFSRGQALADEGLELVGSHRDSFSGEF